MESFGRGKTNFSFYFLTFSGYWRILELFPWEWRWTILKEPGGLWVALIMDWYKVSKGCVSLVANVALFRIMEIFGWVPKIWDLRVISVTYPTWLSIFFMYGEASPMQCQPVVNNGQNFGQCPASRNNCIRTVSS